VKDFNLPEDETLHTLM